MLTNQRIVTLPQGDRGQVVYTWLNVGMCACMRGGGGISKIWLRWDRDGWAGPWVNLLSPPSYQLGSLCSGHQNGNLIGEFGFFAHRLYSTITYRYVTQYYLLILLINTGTYQGKSLNF